MVTQQAAAANRGNKPGSMLKRPSQSQDQAASEEVTTPKLAKRITGKRRSDLGRPPVPSPPEIASNGGDELGLKRGRTIRTATSFAAQPLANFFSLTPASFEGNWKLQCGALMANVSVTRDGVYDVYQADGQGWTTLNRKIVLAPGAHTFVTEIDNSVWKMVGANFRANQDIVTWECEGLPLSIWQRTRAHVPAFVDHEMNAQGAREQDADHPGPHLRETRARGRGRGRRKA